MGWLKCSREDSKQASLITTCCSSPYQRGPIRKKVSPHLILPGPLIRGHPHKIERAQGWSLPPHSAGNPRGNRFLNPCNRFRRIHRRAPLARSPARIGPSFLKFPPIFATCAKNDAGAVATGGTTHLSGASTQKRPVAIPGSEGPQTPRAPNHSLNVELQPPRSESPQGGAPRGCHCSWV